MRTSPDETGGEAGGEYDNARNIDAPYAVAPYSSAPYAVAPYSSAPHSDAPYGSAPYGGDPYNQARSQVPPERIDIDNVDVDALDDDQVAALLGRLDKRGSGPARARADLRAGLLLTAAAVTSVIAWFFPLWVITVSDDALRFYIWITSNTQPGSAPALRTQWLYGIPFALAAALALWAAFALVRARGRGRGRHRQPLFTAAAGVFIGVCGLGTFSALGATTADELSGGLVSTPGAGLFLIGLSAALAIAALVLDRLSVRGR